MLLARYISIIWRSISYSYDNNNIPSINIRCLIESILPIIANALDILIVWFSCKIYYHICTGIIIMYNSNWIISFFGFIFFQANENEIESRMCIICMEKVKTIIVIPCGHKVFCDHCSQVHKNHNNNQTNQCPICRKPVQSFVKVYE